MVLAHFNTADSIHLAYDTEGETAIFLTMEDAKKHINEQYDTDTENVTILSVPVVW